MKGLATSLAPAPFVLRMPKGVHLTGEQFYDLCQANRDLHLECDSSGNIIVMSPTGGRTGSRNAALTAQLWTWARTDGSGVAFDSDTGFSLPNGSTRSPDAAWILRSRVKEIPEERREKFLPLCPDFVVELRSPSDRISDLKAKMEEYMETGAQLGWLLEPESRRAYVFRPRQPTELLENPGTLSGDPVLPGFILDLRDIWEPAL
jgi:Uma2 family endonuclease